MTIDKDQPKRAKAILIAGTHSGCGKTSVALGLMAALTARGYAVQPFKVGPDFIDPGHHRRVTGRESHNLDGWMLDQDSNRSIVGRSVQDADIAVIEGVMGLFDGFSGTQEAGSTAQMAKWLGIPPLLVADVRSMARSAAALIQGYASFDPDLALAGLLLNRVGSQRHRDILKQALTSAGSSRIWGFLPRRSELEIPSRHLGLVTDDDWDSGADVVDRLGGWIEDSCDLDGLVESAPDIETGPQPEALSPRPSAPSSSAGSGVRIGLARDAAFCFYYGENLRLLRQAGAELIFFSPLTDKALPEDLQGLYLGGGYPELHSRELADNLPMLESIRMFCGSGRPVYAECGGFMYLMRDLRDLEGQRQSLAGIFPFGAFMEGRFRALGYREVRTRRPSLLGPAGTRLRGHEFHYSRIDDPVADQPLLYELIERQGAERLEGFCAGNVLGSYVHLHWGSCPEAAISFVQACSRYR